MLFIVVFNHYHRNVIKTVNAEKPREWISFKRKNYQNFVLVKLYVPADTVESVPLVKSSVDNVAARRLGDNER